MLIREIRGQKIKHFRETMLKKFILLLVLTVSTLSIAEYSWMVGGEGETGYIFVPKSQQYSTAEAKVNMNGTSYQLDISNRLFKQIRLPLVNSVVELNSYADMLSISQIYDKERIEQYAKDTFGSYEYNKKLKTATVKSYHQNAGFLILRPTALVRILGYQNFYDKERPQLGELLFVHVVIERD